MMDNECAKNEVAAIMRRLYARGLTTTLGGNVSLRLGEMVYITPSQTDKGSIDASQIAIVGLDGTLYTPHLTKSMETPVHLAIYKTFPEVGTVVHAHPVFASAFSAMELTIDTSLIAESRMMLKEVSKATFALMGSEALSENVVKAMKVSGAVLLENHGAITTGASLTIALERMEVLENAAKITFITHLMSSKKTLTPEQIGWIDSM